MIAIGFTGNRQSVQALVLAFPGVVGTDGTPVTAGSTSVMNRALARTVSPLLRPTGETFARSFVWGGSEPSTVIVIEPLVVEVDADAAADFGTLRHDARLRRVRGDLDPSGLESAADAPLVRRVGLAVTLLSGPRFGLGHDMNRPHQLQRDQVAVRGS